MNRKGSTREQREKSSAILNNYYNSIFGQWKDKVECYPLLIYNAGDKSAYHGYIRIIQQAKDTDGKWKPIEFFSNVPSCIPIQTLYEDLPKKYTVSSVIKYNGNFKTKLRTKIMINRQVYYSNAIDGYINRTQFDRDIAKKTLENWFPDRGKDFFDYYMPYTFLEDKP